MSAVSHSKVTSASAQQDRHGAETDKRNKPLSLWDETEWGLMSRYLAFLQIRSSHKLDVLFVHPQPLAGFLKEAQKWLTEEVHWLAAWLVNKGQFSILTQDLSEN